MTFAETSMRDGEPQRSHRYKDAFAWLGETPNRTAGKKNKPLRLPALDTG